MSTETTNKKIKIDNGTTFGRTYTDKAIDAKLPTDLIATANKLSLGAGSTALGNGVNLSGFTYDEATKTLKASGGEGGISVIELTDKNGTIASTQLGEINANPQNFSFKYNGKILLFTSADSTTYQYCNNITSSSENNVMTTSTLLTITSSTGAYTIAENVHNVVANSIHPANGGDLTNIQVGSKVYSIPSGGGGGIQITDKNTLFPTFTFEAKAYKIGDEVNLDTPNIRYIPSKGEIMRPFALNELSNNVIKLENNELIFIVIPRLFAFDGSNGTVYICTYRAICIKEGTLTSKKKVPCSGYTYKVSLTN